MRTHTSRPLRKSSIVMWTLIVLMLMFLAASLVLRRRPVATTTPEEKAYPVLVQTVALQSVDDILELPGRLDPDLRARLATDMGGRVTEILVDEGATVAAGQTLLRLDDRTARASLALAAIERREAERDLHRWEELVRAGAVSTGEFDTVSARVDLARIHEEQATIQLSQGEVRSPTNGLINQRLIEVGEFAPEGAAVMELLVTDPLKLSVQIPERDISSVRVGDAMPFTIAALGNTLHTGRVTYISAAAAPPGNSFLAEARVANPDAGLRGGMIASVRLQRDRRDDALVVPLAAIIPRKGEHVVFIARADMAVRQTVVIDRILGANAILREGLAIGDELIIEGHRSLVDGARIERITAQD